MSNGLENPLRDRVALVTGAGRGIGREIAIGLAAMGARVALVARSENELGEAVAEIHAAGGIATAVVTDVQDAGKLHAGVQRVRAELGSPEVLINNAAVVTPIGPTDTLDRMVIAAAAAINIVAPISLSAMLLPGMTGAGWGRIVNISSGIVGSPGSSPGMTVYAACKAALEAHTLNLAAELDGTGVTVNAYRPGAVDTAMQRWIREQPAEQIGAALHDRFAAMHTEGRLITSEQSARLLLDRITGPQNGQIWSVTDSAQ
ncbi:MAG TPA: SDR family NAD(P)-dependent oxidoreductase [Solirubrobacteraceae bacterium]|jgi:3-oxoacyl-[acyl-carrier protein] reductase